jgi:RecB family endonuclease NucS
VSGENVPVTSRKPVVVLVNPSVEKAVLQAKDAFSKRQGLLIVGNCLVDYRGRANSNLKTGERIAVFKEDGSVLIHRPVGYEPVNWQPPGCIYNVSAMGDSAVIKAVRRKPPESVRVSFDRVYLLSVLNLIDEGEFALHASEEDMQKAVLMMPSLVEDGLKLITYEKRVEPGFVDVYCEDKAGRFVVIEIKRKTAGKQAALQLAKYVEAVKGIVNKEVRGILTAPALGKGVQRLLATLGLEFKALDPRKCAEVLSKSETKRLQEFFEATV